MATISLHLSTPAVQPEQALRGEVRWTGASQRDAIQLNLLWTTEGKGTRDVRVVERKEIATSGADGDAPFEFIAPGGPWSFSGSLITLAWKVEALLTSSGACETVDVVIAPEAREVRV